MMQISYILSRKLFDAEPSTWLVHEIVIEILPATTEALAKACHLLKDGKCIGIPTETVYGLAADGLNSKACAGIFQIKQRPSFDPLILHIHEGFDLNAICTPTSLALSLSRHFWPGPMTLVLPKKEVVPDIVTSGLETVAIRCPDHPVAQMLLREFKNPLAAPSANRFGRVSPTDPLAVAEELGNSIELVLDGGPCRIGIESTIIDCTGDFPKILRKGGITREQILTVTGKIDDTPPQPAIAPGMLENHYAPQTPLFISDRPISEIPILPLEYGYLFWNFFPKNLITTFKQLTPNNSSIEAAVNLFRYLRELDKTGVKAIIADPIPTDGIGLAILDRLTKASRGTATFEQNQFSLKYLK